MPSPARTRATILAHHLYDFAECEHRIALDVTLPRERRTPPDHAMELLFEHGRGFERRVVEPLGYPAIEVVDGDWEGAFERTCALMRAGVAGIDQGVLLDGGRLARPDLLERVPGGSRLGEFHYVPGDVKSAGTARSDAVLQVGFAALLLEAVQGVRPATGFLVLGDERREELDLEAIRCTIEDAVERAEEIAAGSVRTDPFLSPACARCRWRDECLPLLEAGRDLSFVHGMTRTRRRVLRRLGVATLDELAVADLGALILAGAPGDGLERMRTQARALLEGRVLRQRAVPLPTGARREAYLRIEADPLDHGEPFLLSWGHRPVGESAVPPCEVAVVSSADERSVALRALVEALESPALAGEPVYTFGIATARAFEALAEGNGLAPGRAGDLAGRFVDLAPWVRRAGVFPVFSYRFEEISAVACSRARPSPGRDGEDLFVLHAGLAANAEPGGVRSRLEEAGRDAVASLAAIRRWLGRSADQEGRS